MPKRGQCVVCNSRRVADVDAMRERGEAWTAIAAATGLNRMSIKRHWEKCRGNGKVPAEKGELVGESALPKAISTDGFATDDPQRIRAEVYRGTLKSFRAATRKGEAMRQAALLPGLRGLLRDAEEARKTANAGQDDEAVEIRRKWAVLVETIVRFIAEHPTERAPLRAALSAALSGGPWDE